MKKRNHKKEKYILKMPKNLYIIFEKFPYGVIKRALSKQKNLHALDWRS